MIETSELNYRETTETFSPVQPFRTVRDVDSQHNPGPKRRFGQVLRFGVVGGLNTVVDLLILNSLLLLFPTNSTAKILAYSALAYSLGAVNSFLLNKYWTFGFRQRTTWREVVRFVVTTLFGMGWSSIILWFASNALHPFMVNPTIWANVAKVIALSGTAIISYVGMSLWVFVSKTRKESIPLDRSGQAVMTSADKPPQPLKVHTPDTDSEYMQATVNEYKDEPISSHGISIVLPAYNEEQVITHTIATVLNVMNTWRMDFEILVVNDGSTDSTGEIVAELAEAHPQVHLITHATNEGYGASLVSGFAAATKELTFFMDSDGQFDIRDLRKFFPLIDEYDAVFGYRIDRQDSWMRKLNAWGWKHLIGLVLGVHVKDVDCAFKLLHTEFLHEHPLQTRGAMINAELLYRLKRPGCSYKEIGVHHLPRLHGRATGARPGVILRAFRELFVSARAWRQEEQRLTIAPVKQEVSTRNR